MRNTVNMQQLASEKNLPGYLNSDYHKFKYAKEALVKTHSVNKRV